MTSAANGSSARWNWCVPAQAGRADRAILEALEQGQGSATGEVPPCSRSQLQRLIEEGHVRLDGFPIKANSKLRGGSVVEIEFPAPKPTQLIPEERELEVLFEDKHLLVLNKPAGLTVHPSTTQMEGTLVHALLHHVKDLSGIGGVMRPGIVHRLDKDTSGVLVISKTDEAHRALVETFSKHAIERRYWALSYGSPKQRSGTIETLIGRNPKDRKKMTTQVKEGRRAVSHYRRIEEYAAPGGPPFSSWIEITLETGRTHQIRVHLTTLGHSVLGDPVYGTPTERHPKWLALPKEIRDAVQALPGQALHAHVLGFKHPVTGESLRFEGEPPAEFKELLAKLQRFK